MLSFAAPRTGTKRWGLGALTLTLAFLLWFWGIRSTEPQLPPPPNPWAGPTPVHVVSATKTDLKVYIKAIGSVTPLNTVILRSQVNGQLQRLSFTEGQRVQQGDLLATIDPASYEVRLAQAQGTLQQTQAQLKSAEDDLKLYNRLLAQKSIAQQQYDKQESLVAQWRGTLKTHQAQVADARLQLSYTLIKAPISGRTGLRRMDVGNLVSSGDSNGLVTITQTQPIAVTFSIPENQLVALRRAHKNASSPLLVEAWDSSDQQLLASGELTTLDNQIDTSTGSLKLKAQFANSDDQLFPNQFINARLQLLTLKDAITIPGDAVQYGAKGTYVYLVEEGKAKLRLVTLGALEGDSAEVTSGLSGGESVILEGLDRLWEGKDVKVMDPAQEAAAVTQQPRRNRPANGDGKQGQKGSKTGKQERK
jgi:membrane fusion protein, multidrug efflux system